MRAKLLILPLILSLALTTSALASSERLKIFINRREIQLQNKLLRDGDRVSVPLREVANYLGAEVEYLEDDKAVSLRWGLEEEASLPLRELLIHDELAYIAVERLAQILDAKLINFTGSVYIFAHQTELLSLSYGGDGVSLQFSRLAPFKLSEMGKEISIEFFNSILNAVPRNIRVANGAIEEVKLSRESPHKIRLSIRLRYAVDYQLRKTAGEDGFSLKLEFNADDLFRLSSQQNRSEVGAGKGREKKVQLNPWIYYYRLDLQSPYGWVRVNYLKIGDHRAHYRPMITVPKDGIGDLETLEDMVRRSGGVAGINANFFDPNTKVPIGLLIKDGTVLSSSHEQRAVLAVGLFGRLTFFNPILHLYLKPDNGEEIKIANVNQPLGQDDLVLYTPHYEGPIRTATPAKVVKIKDDQVLAVGGSSFIQPDRSSIVLVATGSAMERLDLAMGDRVEFRYVTDPDLYLPIRNAISAGPLLIKGGQMAIDAEGESFEHEFIHSRAARSAIAVTDQGDLIMLTVSKNEQSVGMNLLELAQLLEELGARDAMALDGGGSSSLVFREGLKLWAIGNRKIAVGLVLIPK